ncbi:MAG: acyloxyacyl hydrolase [Bacteroidales bacterium]
MAKKNSFRVYTTLVALFLSVPLLYSNNSNPSDTLSRLKQMPPFMQNIYFEVNVGYIDYPFGEGQLQPGYRLDGVEVRHPAVRLVLFGYKIAPWLNGQVTYTRPIWWVMYHYQKEGVPTIASKSVWMNIAAITLRPQLAIGDKFKLYGEGGLGIVTRHGIKDSEGDVVVKDLTFSTFTTGGGVTYNLSRAWDLSASLSYTFPVKGNDQPPIFYSGFGFKYNFSPFGEKKMAKAKERGTIYPKQWVSLNYSSNILGYGVNNTIRKAYLFWGGDVEIDHGYMASYYRNLFNGPKVFSFDVGANFSYWKTNLNGEPLWSFSLFPQFRFNFLRGKGVDPYFFYVLGGPAYLSQSFLDGKETGRRFTFYDAMGLGLFWGKRREYNVELKIAHYSNGNLFPINSGIKIPLSLSLGYAF